MRAPNAAIGPVNLGNPGEFTMRELAELVISMTDSSSTVVTRPLPVDDPRQRCPDISMAEELYGWKPVIPLKAGLSRTIAYFANELWLGPLAEEKAA
jgi:UDP-glucuronate decarboxylase